MRISQFSSKSQFFSQSQFCFFLSHFCAEMLSSLCWIAGSAAKSKPVRFVPTEQELEEAKRKYHLGNKGSTQKKEDTRTEEEKRLDEELKEYDMDKYDEEDSGNFLIPPFNIPNKF